MRHAPLTIGLAALLAVGLAAPANATAYEGSKTTSNEITTVVPGAKPQLGLPLVGQSAEAVRGIGIVASTRNERPIPIASLTKMMTALVILFDHPLVRNEQGPILTVSAADVAAYQADIVAGDSTLKVALGEQLSEYSLLEGLLLPSGDNIADLLAVWDAGSVAAFVAKMNAMAQTLSLVSTHYADASGVSPGSRSTATDQASLAATLMGYGVIRRIVRMRDAVLPVAGTVPNYNPAAGVDGIIGVKSGWSSEAQSCLATAAYRTIKHHSVLVISVTLGQGQGLIGAARVDEHMLDLAPRSLLAVDTVAPRATFQVRIKGGTATLRAPRHPPVIIGWPGLKLEGRIDDPLLLASGDASQIRAGTVVATLDVVAPWGTVAQVPLQLRTATTTTTTTTMTTTTSTVPN